MAPWHNWVGWAFSVHIWLIWFHPAYRTHCISSPFFKLTIELSFFMRVVVRLAASLGIHACCHNYLSLSLIMNTHQGWPDAHQQTKCKGLALYIDIYIISGKGLTTTVLLLTKAWHRLVVNALGTSELFFGHRRLETYLADCIWRYRAWAHSDQVMYFKTRIQRAVV